MYKQGIVDAGVHGDGPHLQGYKVKGEDIEYSIGMVPYQTKALEDSNLVCVYTSSGYIDCDPCVIVGLLKIGEESPSIGKEMDGGPTIKEDPVGADEGTALLKFDHYSIAVAA